MKIRIDVPSAILRRALVDLLEDAGHVVETSGAVGEFGLQILAEPGTQAPAPRVATLYLRPGRDARMDDDPVGALRAALRTAGVAVWASPFDAEGLLEALAPEGTAPRPTPPPVAPDAPLAAAPDPWLLISPRTREVAWASDSATARFVEPGGRRLSARGEAAVPPAVFERVDGCEFHALGGRPHLVVWWTESRGRRCVGFLRLPKAATEPGEENVETLAELGRVSATLAHEIRNPLASFAGALDLLAREADPAERAGVLQLARERLDQMKTMLDDALRLVRPFRGPPEAVSAEEVVRSAVASARTDAAFQRIDLHVEIGSPPVGEVLAHPEPLRQAILNLLVNAAQAQEGKGRVIVRIETAGGFGVIGVHDAGPGIPGDVRERVFLPFWTTKTRGTGLGLTFVKRVAEAAGGRARVEESARGAAVRMELPLAGPP